MPRNPFRTLVAPAPVDIPRNPFTALIAPPVLPDITSDEYQAARRVLEDHPVTASMPPMDLSSLAQHLVNVITDGLFDEIDDLRNDLAETQNDLKAVDKERAALNRQLGKARREIAALKAAAA